MSPTRIFSKRGKRMNRFTDFTEEEQRMLAEALWKKQRSFIAGDRMFKSYEKLLNEVLEDFNYVPGRVL
jgi:hypothetical protein